MSYHIIFTPRAREGIIGLYTYYAEKAGENVAGRLISGLHLFCDGLNMFPQRGTLRNDLYPGLRSLSYKSWARITFTVNEDAQKVVIHGVYGSRQDFDNVIEIDEGDV